MRGFLSFILFVIGAAIVAALAIFAVENVTSVPLTFLGFHFPGNVWWISIGSAILGFVLASLLLLPSLATAGWRSRALRREHEQTERQVAEVRARYEQLEREHDRLRAEYQQAATERDRLRAQAVASTATAQRARPGEPVRAPRAQPTEPVAGQPGQPGQAARPAQPAEPMSAAQPAQPTEPARPAQPAEPATSGAVPGDAAARPADVPEEQPAPLSERLRGAEGRPPRPEEEAAAEDWTGYPQGPTVPSA